MKFSICIPNYNYEKYLGLTLDSVLVSTYKNFEVLISDNASTDGSIDVIRKKQEAYGNIKWKINSSNIGFAANLDRSGEMATGDIMIMLSSDDLIKANAMTRYSEVIGKHPEAIVCSSWDIIDSAGSKIGYTGPNKALWKKEDVDPLLSKQFDCNVYRVNCSVLLKRCLLNMATPFNFCTAAYSRAWYDKVGGYGGGRLINPDKWFHWKLLTVAKEAIFIDSPFFQYRWHDQNQNAQQKQSGHIKYLLDEYRSTIEIDNRMLDKAAITRDELTASFIKNDIYRHGIGEFTKSRWLKSLRIFFFGLSTYPSCMIFNLLFPVYILMLMTTPIGSYFVSLLRRK